MTDLRACSSFETHRFAMLLRMTMVRVIDESPSSHRAFDLAVRLIGRQKDVVVVI